LAEHIPVVSPLGKEFYLSLFSKILLNWRFLIIGKWLDIYKINKQHLAKGHTGRVVTIWTDPNVFPMTLATGNSGKEEGRKGCLLPKGV
jgi:hypothetical protein